MDQAATAPPAGKGPTTAHVVVLLLLCVIIVLLPFALGSVIIDITHQATTVYRIHSSDVSNQATYADAHLQVIAINEWQGTALIRMSMHRFCQTPCTWTDQVLLVSAFGDTSNQDRGRPATQTVALAPPNRDVVSLVELPIFGDPIRYPYDRYQLAIGVILERVNPDGSAQTLAPDEARRYLTLTLQGRIPRATMASPRHLDAAEVQTDPQEFKQFMAVELLTFQRPFYLKVLTVLLVLLVTAAAAYAVFLRPLDQLIINSGALVLGVWGVRSILLGTDLNGITAVDLALATVILFLLVTITVRTAYLLEDSSRLRVFKRRSRAKSADNLAVPPAPSEPPSYVPGAEGRAGEAAATRPARAPEDVGRRR